MTEEKARFPFSMVEKMMPMFPAIAVMGWMLALIGFLVGLLVLSPAQASFYSASKVIREAAGAGSPFVLANTTIHAIEAWLPQVKFFGLGLGLLAIVMALGTIAKRLRRMGNVIISHMPEAMRPDVPPPPKTVKVFQLSSLMGIMLMMVALIIGIVLAISVVPAYWSNSIADVLNPAQAGSGLLGQAGLVKSFALWLSPLRMVGMAFLFTGVTLALTVIVGTLRLQTKLLSGLYRAASGQQVVDSEEPVRPDRGSVTAAPGGVAAD